MEAISSWDPSRVSHWLQGLEDSVQHYPFAQWQVNGEQLLRLSPQELEELGVTRVGHQELILEAVELLCALTYDLERENLKALMEKMRAVSVSVQTCIMSRRKVFAGAKRTPTDLLLLVMDLLQATKAIFSWLNRYPFLCIVDYSTVKRRIIQLCMELARCVNKDHSTEDKEDQVLTVCRELSELSELVQKSSPKQLLCECANLERVQLVTVSPGQSLGIEIKSNNGLHFITGTTANSPARRCQKIQAGDEVVKVNDSVVVGWTLRNLVSKLREDSHQVVLVMKKVPVDSMSLISASDSPQSQTVKRLSDDVESCQDLERTSRGSSRTSVPGPDTETMEQPWRTSRPSSVTSHSSTDCEQNRGRSDSEAEPTRATEGNGGLVLPLLVKSSVRTECEAGDSSADAASPGQSAPSGAEPVQGTPESGNTVRLRTRRKKKGVATALSRRRISCRDLGLGECYGWLWKKKENARFMSHKWNRRWFVLKGPSLYWYSSESDEKAEGFVKLPSYVVEAAGEHKRKFVFQLSHKKFKSFVFSSENVDEMKKWIKSLISAIRKYKPDKHWENKEEDCWSETETEEVDDSPEAPQPSNAPRTTSYQQAQRLSDLPPVERYRMNSEARGVPVAKKPENTDTLTPGSKQHHSPISPSRPGRESIPKSTDELEVLMKCLQQGGVSLIGKQQPFCKDYRKSFIKRSKNPIINEKAHRLRTLHSTLKAKELDLQSINKILDDNQLTVDKFRLWKQENQELLTDIIKNRHAGRPQGDRTGRDPPEYGQEMGLGSTTSLPSQGSFRLSCGKASPSGTDEELGDGNHLWTSRLSVKLGGPKQEVDASCASGVETGHAVSSPDQDSGPSRGSEDRPLRRSKSHRLSTIV
ncbi:connector enhancer of kinase suppressor of ras 1 isoform X2 [Callorhinchus milii]|uniref:connector enhancer of kinase suppressor of ras 1 isoform X2 n=1 Tax=Callorhinchus milii TaxID=7868 RepID=UPI001C3F612D|nr:connector enhancer of kinase suppressor of ras 1 isoform X2 [Callorhinchus milii]